MSDDQKKRFSPQARQAAADAKRRFAAAKSPVGSPQMFVVRFTSPQSFGWEIRSFGSFVLRRSETGFSTQLLAQTAGEKALVALTAL